jgi:hypothetical protein
VGLLAEATRMIWQQHGLDIDPILFIVESTRWIWLIKAFLHQVSTRTTGRT